MKNAFKGCKWKYLFEHPTYLHSALSNSLGVEVNSEPAPLSTNRLFATDVNANYWLHKLGITCLTRMITKEELIIRPVHPLRAL